MRHRDLREIKRFIAERDPKHHLVPGLNYLQPIFRSFKDPTWADALASGYVWLSTIETCRKYEDALQGDCGEAEQIYNIKSAIGGDPRFDLDFMMLTGRPAIQNVGTMLHDCKVSHRIEDAYVFCASEHHDYERLGPESSGSTVQIDDPMLCFWLIRRAFTKLRPDFTQAAAYKVAYGSRENSRFCPPPGRVGFVKPVKFASQQEVRLTIEVRVPLGLKPFGFEVPMLNKYVKRII